MFVEGERETWLPLARASFGNIQTNKCGLFVAEIISFDFVLPKAPFSAEGFHFFLLSYLLF